MLRASLIILFTLGLIAGCGSISLLDGSKEKDLYSKNFLSKIGKIKEVYSRGEADSALRQLKEIDERELLPTEKGMRRNLMGVIYFSKGDYEQAILNFDSAISNSRLDEELSSQIYLNAASSYFKLGHIEKAYETLEKADFKKLPELEEKKYHKLRYTLAKELGRESDLLSSLAYYLGSYKTLNELKADIYFEIITTAFFALTHEDRLSFLDDFERNDFLIMGYLGYLEAEKLYYKGDKGEAQNILAWVKEGYSQYSDIEYLVTNFNYRIDNAAKLDPQSIGVILPLSGNRSGFGERALLGIDKALRSFKNINGDEGESGASFKLHIKDSKGSGAVGAFSVKELVEKHYVSVIIGGLFSAEATKEYLEAKKHGVLFISLSQIYLPKEKKDHLLIEVPGSVESQVGQVFSDEMLTKFGRRAAIVYPKSARGDAYINEFWRRAQLSNVNVTGALSFEKGQNDYRDPIKNLLGLKFTRERQEELEILKEIHSLEKNRSIRRLQTLRPQIDFDWIFIPAFPKEALQLIPSFSYFDAFKLNIIGGPSWRSQTLSRESYKLGKLYFIGDEVNERSKVFSSEFIEAYKKRPRLIEMRAYDALKVTKSLLAKPFESRDELDINVRSQKLLTGITGDWEQEEGIWIKKMVSLSMKRGKIQNVFYTKAIDVQEAPIN